MFSNPHLDRARQSFAGQFEPDGADFLYWKNLKGPPIRVSRIERDDFVQTFNRRLFYWIWLFVLVMLVPTAGARIILAQNAETTALYSAVLPFLCLILSFLSMMIFYRRIWNQPARDLARRLPEGEARSKKEIRRKMLAKISYGQIGAFVPVALGNLWHQSRQTDIFHGWGMLWLAFTGGILILAAILAFQKWRSERDPSRS